MKTQKFFFISEISAFTIQVLIFFCLTLLMSNFLTIESDLIKFAENKLNSKKEFMYTFISTIFASGLLTLIQKLIDDNNAFWHKIIDDTLLELPRIIYLFGSSIVAISIAVGIYLKMNPHADSSINYNFFFIYGLFLACMFFIYGCGLKFLLVRKTLQSK